MSHGQENERLIKANPKDQKIIEALISAFTIMLSNEKEHGADILIYTLPIINEDAYQKTLKAFDKKGNPLLQKAKEILLSLRDINKVPINAALSLFIILNIKIRLSQQKIGSEKSKSESKKKMGF